MTDMPGTEVVVLDDRSGHVPVAPLPMAVTEPPKDEPLLRLTVGVLATDQPGLYDQRVRGDYCEEYWLPLIGPAAYLIARRMDLGLSTATTLPVQTRPWAKSMGLTKKGQPDLEKFHKALNRLVRFGLAEWNGKNNFLLRRHWPVVPAAIMTPQHHDVLLSLPDA